MDVAHKVIDIARWAPSGDNTQPWRFEIVDPMHIVVHGFDTRSDCVYDLEGHASQLAHGALLQSMIYAGSELGFDVEWQRREDSPESKPLFDVRLRESATVTAHPLATWVKVRATQRRPMAPGSLTDEEKSKLEQAAGPGFSLRWWESAGERLRHALFLFKAARLRLVTPEAFEVHRRIIEWGAKFSEDKIPESAVGLSALSLVLSKWTFGAWRRMHLMNSIPGATWVPRFELDLFPGFFCAAHYALLSDRPPQSIDDYVNAGMAVQRVWLQATALNVQQQPEMTPLIFKGYVVNEVPFTEDVDAKQAAQQFAASPAWDRIAGEDFNRFCWMGRFGRRAVTTRSTRLGIDALAATSSD